MTAPLTEQIAFASVDVPESAAASAEAAIRFLANHLAETGLLPADRVDRVVGQVLHREALGSTAAGSGIALPHARSELVSRLVGAVGHSPAAVRWPGVPDSEPIHTICLIIGPVGEPEVLLRALEEAVNTLRA